MPDKHGNLKQCVLCRGLSEEEIEGLFSVIGTDYRRYDKDQLIASEGDTCESLSIILNGEVEIQNIFPSGRVFTLSKLGTGDIFGEGILFSNQNTYPISVTATATTWVLRLSKEDIKKGFLINDKLMMNYMSLLSNKLIHLNRRLKMLSLESIRQKICTYLLNEYKKQNSLYLTGTLQKKKMAELMGIQRPSLSREFINMREDGLIDFDRDVIRIMDLEGVENALFG
jgi:CRP-like cAMP-binding protein